MVDTIITFIQGKPDQVNAIVAICALFISFIAIILTVWTLWLQRNHNFLSVTPIVSIPVSDYENNIAVKVKNTGVGPLIIETFRATDGATDKDDLISWMPSLPTGMYWSTFYDNLDGICIPSGEEAIILRLEGDVNNKQFTATRDNIRRALSKLKVTVQYKDIYNRKMPPKERDLSWFGRHDG